MPRHAYIYALPYEIYEKYKLRKYGFHGTSHKYVAHRAAQMLGKPIESLKLITCHLGNGASICAVKAENPLTPQWDLLLCRGCAWVPEAAMLTCGYNLFDGKGKNEY